MSSTPQDQCLAVCQELERLRADLATAHALLREASDDWVPHASSLSEAIVEFLRGNAPVEGGIYFDGPTVQEQTDAIIANSPLAANQIIRELRVDLQAASEMERLWYDRYYTLFVSCREARASAIFRDWAEQVNAMYRERK